MLDIYSVDLMIRNKSPYEIFGDNVDSKLKELLIVCHPDRQFQHYARELAIYLSQQLSLLAEEARKPRLQIDNYLLYKDLEQGDSSYIRIFTDIAEKQYIVKTPLNKKLNGLLGAEFNLTKEIVAASKDYIFSKMYGKPVEIVIDAKDKVSHFVYEYNNELIAMPQLMRKYPNGLDGRHIVWISKRILIALSWMHSLGYSHNAINLEHILIDVRNHMVQLIGLLHSSKIGEKPNSIPSKYVDVYPKKWISDIKKGSVGLDVYLTMTTMLSICNEQVPTKLKNFLRGIQLEALTYPQNCVTIHDEITDLAQKIYGKPKFVELVV